MACIDVAMMMFSASLLTSTQNRSEPPPSSFTCSVYSFPLILYLSSYSPYTVGVPTGCTTGFGCISGKRVGVGFGFTVENSMVFRDFVKKYHAWLRVSWLFSCVHPHGSLPPVRRGRTPWCVSHLAVPPSRHRGFPCQGCRSC